MVVKENEYMYGTVLYRLIEYSGRELTVGHIPNDSRGFYLVNEKVPLYIKYTAKKVTPWLFSFSRKHQDDLQEVYDIYGTAVIVFICGHDGLCAISFDEFKNVLDYYHEDMESVIIKRKKGEKYGITGRDGTLGRKIGDRDFPKIIDDILKSV